MKPTLFFLIFYLLLSTGLLSALPAQNTDTAQIVRLKWINFSPFTKLGQNPNNLSVIPESQIIALLDTLRPWVEGVRTFGTQNGPEKIPRLAKERGLKVILGIWLGRDTSVNAIEIANGIAIAKEGYADRIIVGSEALLRRELSSAQIIQYINHVKQACPGIPVSYADVYYKLIENPAVVAACDFVAPNIYPFWEGIPVECAMQQFHQAYLSLLSIAGEKEIFISESGWKTKGRSQNRAIASLENAVRYDRELLGWSEALGVEVNIFSAFDEPWKGSFDDGWGIFDNDAILKPGMEKLFEPFDGIDSTWLCREPDVNGADTLSIDFVPVIGSRDIIKGHVNYLASCDYKIAMYIKVNNGWWTKPTFAQPASLILCDGTWEIPYATGGNDISATEICLFVIPAGYTPPRSSGRSSIPPEIYQHAITWKCVQRYKLPQATVTANSQTICDGDSTTLTAGGGRDYLWDTGDTTVSIRVSPNSYTTYFVTVTDGMGGGAIVNVRVEVKRNNASVQVDPNPHIICPGDTATLRVTEGASYLWNTGQTEASIRVSPIIPTSYTVTVTDSLGCIKSISAKVDVDVPGLQLHVDRDSICPGGSTYLTTSSISYYRRSYLWNTGETSSSLYIRPTSTTTYSVTLTTAFGCKDTSSQRIVVLPLPIATAHAEPSPVCRGETTTLTANGGVSYQWNTGETGDSIQVTPDYSRSYRVTVTDSAGCKATADTSVTVLYTPSANISLSDTSICAGNAATLRISTSGAKSYLWSNGDNTASITASPPNTTTYTVTVTYTNGCSITRQQELIVHPLPKVSLVGLESSYLDTVSKVILLGEPRGGRFFGNGVSDSTFIPVSAGTGLHKIFYAFEDANGCEGIDSVTVSIINGISFPTDINSVHIFPQPNSGVFWVYLEMITPQAVEIELVNAIGRVLETRKEQPSPGQNRLLFEKQALPAGLYFLIFRTKEGGGLAEKLVIVR